MTVIAEWKKYIVAYLKIVHDIHPEKTKKIISVGIRSCYSSMQIELAPAKLYNVCT